VVCNLKNNLPFHLLFHLPFRLLAAVEIQTTEWHYFLSGWFCQKLLSEIPYLRLWSHWELWSRPWHGWFLGQSFLGRNLFYNDSFADVLFRGWHGERRLSRRLPTTSTFGVTFSKALSKLKAHSSNVSFHWNMAKETFELWALSFETAFEHVIPNGIGCTRMLQRATCNAKTQNSENSSLHGFEPWGGYNSIDSLKM